MKVQVVSFKFQETHPSIQAYKPTQAGFSLIEILVSIALLAIISGIGISLFAIINNSYTRANTISRLQSQGSSVSEIIERSIRSATSATTSPTYGCPGGVTQCLSLLEPINSLEYQTNGGCSITQYNWTAPATSTSNGTLSRAWLNSAGANCNGTSDLFDTDTTQGISAEAVSGNTIFTVTPDSAGPAKVAINFIISQAILLKPSSGTDTRASVPFNTTISLRDY